MKLYKSNEKIRGIVVPSDHSKYGPAAGMYSCGPCIVDTVTKRLSASTVAVHLLMAKQLAVIREPSGSSLTALLIFAR